jgi:predicted RNA-binding protein
MVKQVSTTKHWLICIPEDNFRITLKQGLIGLPVSREKAARSFQAGDKVVFYLTRKSSDERSERISLLHGLAEVTGPASLDDTQIWPSFRGEIYPWRIPVRILDESSRAALKPIIGDLTFAPNDMYYWALPLRRGVISMTESDWQRIEAAMRLAAARKTST